VSINYYFLKNNFSGYHIGFSLIRNSKKMAKKRKVAKKSKKAKKGKKR